MAAENTIDFEKLAFALTSDNWTGATILFTLGSEGLLPPDHTVLQNASSEIIDLLISSGAITQNPETQIATFTTEGAALYQRIKLSLDENLMTGSSTQNF